MKPLLITICVILLISPVYAQLKKQYYKDNTIKSAGMHKDGVADGPWKYYNEKGILESEGKKVDGKLHGLWKVYTKDGKLNSTGKYEDGVKSGEWKVYSATGELFYQGKFVNGKKHGFFKFYKGNKTQASGSFQYGKRNGEWVFNNKPGVTEKVVYKRNKISIKETITKGKKKADWVSYYSNEKKQQEGQKLNGLKTGLWTFYYKNNGAKNYSQEYKNRKSDGAYTRYRNSGKTVAKKGQYVKGKKEGKWIEYEITGKVREEVNYKNNKKEGTFKRYHLSKDKLMAQQIGRFVKGTKQGKWKRYYLDGTLKSESNYTNGKLIGATKTYTKKAIPKNTNKPSKTYWSYDKGPSKNRAVNFKLALLTTNPTQLSNLKKHHAYIIKNETAKLGVYKSYIFSGLKRDKDYLFYLITENRVGKPTVKVDGAKQKNFFSDTKEITKGDDKCVYYHAKKKGVKGAVVSFSFSQNADVYMVIYEQDRIRKK